MVASSRPGELNQPMAQHISTLTNRKLAERFASPKWREKTIEEIAAETLENKNYINNTLPGILEGFKNQIDGMIEMYLETEYLH